MEYVPFQTDMLASLITFELPYLPIMLANSGSGRNIHSNAVEPLLYHFLGLLWSNACAIYPSITYFTSMCIPCRIHYRHSFSSNNDVHILADWHSSFTLLDISLLYVHDGSRNSCRRRSCWRSWLCN